MKEESLETLPKIPTHTIGYGDAQQLLKYGYSVLKFRVMIRSLALCFPVTPPFIWRGDFIHWLRMA